MPLLTICIVACQERSFHQDSSAQSTYAFSQPRFAFANAGLGWCAYIEDTSLQPKLYRTNHVYVDSSYDFKTLVERRDRYQRIFSLRNYKKIHDVAINFDAFSKWSEPFFSKSSMSGDVFSAIIQMEKELSGARYDIDGRRHTKLMCERRAAEDEVAIKDGRPLSEDDFAVEYRLRCQYGAEQAIRHTEAAMLSPAGYKLVQKAIYELANEKKWEEFRRIGVKCRDEVTQLESSRGQFLGSEFTKR
jgi:hypothetical protein